MYSISFPDIFNNSKVNLAKDYDAIKINLALLVGANRGSLYGDPHFGTNLKQLLFDQVDSPIIREVIIDEVFESILSYMPQVNIKRDSISIKSVGNTVFASIEVSADESIESNLYNIELVSSDSLMENN